MSSIGVLEAAADAFCADSIDELTAAELYLGRSEHIDQQISGLCYTPKTAAAPTPDA